MTIAEASPASACSNGHVYSTQLLDEVALNLHRIDKDVQRCDRNHPYFTLTNLDAFAAVKAESVRAVEP